MNRSDVRAFWDDQAATFDNEADHGLNDATTRQAWAELLDDLIGPSHDGAIDLGCGTGSVSVLLAERGHSVYGVDLSPNMVEQARAKAQNRALDLSFEIGDVLTARVPSAPCGVVLSRHLLWAVPDPETVLQRWIAPLVDDGIFVAIEGVWQSAGTPAETVIAALEPHFEHVEYTDLSARSELWGKDVTDHRYAVVGRHPRRGPTDRSASRRRRS